jgi:microcystin-dependent protein
MNPFLSELKCVPYTFAPKGWAMANGQLLPISQNQALFALLGATYGGDGRVNFALPNLQTRVPIHTGPGYVLGQLGGELTHTLLTAEMPTHTHVLQGVNVTFSTNAPPSGKLLCNTTGNLGIYGAAGNLVSMFSRDLATSGGSQPHQNQSPYLVMTWIIALVGIFPSQN